MPDASKRRRQCFKGGGAKRLRRTDRETENAHETDSFRKQSSTGRRQRQAQPRLPEGRQRMFRKAAGGLYLDRWAGADQSDRQSFELERLAGQHHDGLEARVLRQQLNAALAALEALNRDLIAQAGDDDLAVLGFLGLFDGQQIATHDAGALHALAHHLEQVVGSLLEQAGLDGIGALNVLLRQDGAAGGHAPHQRQGWARPSRLRENALASEVLGERWSPPRR